MTVLDKITGRINKDAKDEVAQTQKELKDAVRLAREAIDKALAEKHAQASGK